MTAQSQNAGEVTRLVTRLATWPVADVEGRLTAWQKLSKNDPMKCFQKREVAYQKGRLSILAFVVLSLASCRGSKEPFSSDAKIFGGQAVGADELPAVVGIAFANAQGDFDLSCTGTLVAPDLVLTAGHCLQTSRPATDRDATLFASKIRVLTGPGIDGGRMRNGLRVQSVVSHPLLRIHPLGYADFGLIRLVDEVPNITPTPLLTEIADELAAFTRGRVLLAGYGRREDGANGEKYKTWAKVRRLTPDEGMAGGGGHDACSGDSGGPALTVSGDGTMSQLGVVSRGLGLGCGKGGFISLVPDATCWLAEASGGQLPAPRASVCRSEDAPTFSADDLKGTVLSELCTRGRPTQLATLGAIALAVGTDTCEKTTEFLATASTLTLDGLMISDLSPLVHLSQLTSLSLKGNQIFDALPLAFLPALKTLELDGNSIHNFSPLVAREGEGLTVLGKRRQLWNVEATEFLAACLNPELGEEARRTVRAVLWATAASDCHEANARLLSLESLSLRDRKLTDLSPLSYLGQLKVLDLTGNPVVDVGPLSSLERLQDLHLERTEVKDLRPLSGLLQRGLRVSGVTR